MSLFRETTNQTAIDPSVDKYSYPCMSVDLVGAGGAHQTADEELVISQIHHACAKSLRSVRQVHVPIHDDPVRLPVHPRVPRHQEVRPSPDDPQPVARHPHHGAVVVPVHRGSGWDLDPVGVPEGEGEALGGGRVVEAAEEDDVVQRAAEPAAQLLGELGDPGAGEGRGVDVEDVDFVRVTGRSLAADDQGDLYRS